MTGQIRTSSTVSSEAVGVGAAVAELSAAGTPARTPMTMNQAWRAVGEAIADAARDVFSSAEYHIDLQTRSERYNGGGFEHLKIVVSEVGAAKVLGVELPWSSSKSFLEISLHASDSGRYPMQVGALNFRTTNHDGKPVADLISAKVTELAAERGLQRLAPRGDISFEVARKM